MENKTFSSQNRQLLSEIFAKLLRRTIALMQRYTMNRNASNLMSNVNGQLKVEMCQ